MSETVTTIEGEVISLEEAQDRAAESGLAVQLADGSEVCDPTPLAPPIGFTHGPDLIDQIRNMVRREMHLRDDEVLEETEEDAEDFDHPDLDEPFTRHEIDGMSRHELFQALQERGMLKPGKPTGEAPKAAEDAPGVEASPAEKSAGAKPTVP